MKTITVKKRTVRNLWQLCEQRVFAVPEIQREFVWDSRRASDLLDSIYQRLPIGSLLVWQTDSDRRHLLRHAQNILPAYDTINRHIWFLIDGQQRLSVLYRAKEGHEVVNSNGRVLNFSHLCFSFDKRFESRFIFIRRPLRKLHVPLVDALSHNWRKKLRYLSNGKVRQIEECRNRIGSYSVPVITLHTNDLDEVRESFLRINSGGLKISKADRAFSKAARLDLRRLVKELRGSLPHGFNEIDPRTMLASMILIMGQKDIRSKTVDSVIARIEKDEIENGKVSRKFARDWTQISDCVRKAVDYLVNDLKVPNLGFLPSENMVAVLAFFFHANNSAQPSSPQRKELNKWFWATAIGRRYVGRGYYQNIRIDISFFESLGRRRRGRFVQSEKMLATDIRRTDYSSGGSLTTAFFLMLRNRKPSYLETGSTIPLVKTASLSNRNDKHHIFPRALLARNEVGIREANSLCNMCYLVAEENQSFGSNKPIDYLSEYRRLKHFPRVMKTHLIPYRNDSALWERGVRKAYRRFVRERLEWICRAFEKEAGTKLFRKD